MLAVLLLSLSGCFTTLDQSALTGAPDHLACADNLAANGDFETGTAGWRSNVARGVLEWVQPGRDGSAGAARGLYDVGQHVARAAFPDPSPGARYALTAWVRAEGASVDVTPVLKEQGPAGETASHGTAIPAAEEWQRATVTHTLIEDDWDRLLISFRTDDEEHPDLFFLLDDVCLEPGG